MFMFSINKTNMFLRKYPRKYGEVSVMLTIVDNTGQALNILMLIHCQDYMLTKITEDE